MIVAIKRMSYWVLIIGVTFFFMTGCSKDGISDHLVGICNYDNREYTVRLHRDGDDVVVDEFILEKFDFASCDGFNGLKDGWYYITIHTSNTEPPSGTSGAFSVDSATRNIRFIINASGELSYQGRS